MTDDDTKLLDAIRRFKPMVMAEIQRWRGAVLAMLADPDWQQVHANPKHPIWSILKASQAAWQHVDGEVAKELDGIGPVCWKCGGACIACHSVTEPHIVQAQ